MGLKSLFLNCFFLENTLVFLVILGSILTVVPMELPTREYVYPPYFIPEHLVLYSLEILLSFLALILSPL